jgi:hypothetical protein
MTFHMSRILITRLGYFRWQLTFDDPCELPEGDLPSKWCVYARTRQGAWVKGQRLFKKVAAECP